MPKYTKTDKEIAHNNLTRIINGTRDKRLYAIVRSVSKSGMSRRISFLALSEQPPALADHSPDLFNVSWSVAVLLGWSLKEDSIVVKGCGMDMGFHTLYELSRVVPELGINPSPIYL